MADIKAMFRISRFLWWEHGDPRMKVEKFELCAHLFGGKS